MVGWVVVFFPTNALNDWLVVSKSMFHSMNLLSFCGQDVTYIMWALLPIFSRWEIPSFLGSFVLPVTVPELASVTALCLSFFLAWRYGRGEIAPSPIIFSKHRWKFENYILLVAVDHVSFGWIGAHPWWLPLSLHHSSASLPCTCKYFYITPFCLFDFHTC